MRWRGLPILLQGMIRVVKRTFDRAAAAPKHEENFHLEVSMSDISVYGTGWCEDTQATRNHLDSLGVQYRYIDIDQDDQAQGWVKQQNAGKQKTPTVDIAGQILVEPSERDLEEALRGRGLMS